MTSEVVYLGAHERMTPVEALAHASRQEWDDVIVVGFQKDDGTLSVCSSHMTREFALWIAEHLKLYAMKRL